MTAVDVIVVLELFDVIVIGVGLVLATLGGIGGVGGGLRLVTGMRQAIGDLLAPSCCREIEPGQVQPDGLRGKLCDLGGREEGGTARARPRGPVRRLGGGGHDLSREPLTVLPAAELRTRMRTATWSREGMTGEWVSPVPFQSRLVR